MIGTATSVINSITCKDVRIPYADPNQAWFWTPEWQAKEIEADEDLNLGRYREFDSIDEMIAVLDDDAELDSPNCHQDAINELASRDFVRVNDPRILKG